MNGYLRFWFSYWFPLNSIWLHIIPGLERTVTYDIAFMIEWNVLILASVASYLIHMLFHSFLLRYWVWKKHFNILYKVSPEYKAKQKRYHIYNNVDVLKAPALDKHWDKTPIRLHCTNGLFWIPSYKFQIPPLSQTHILNPQPIQTSIAKYILNRIALS